MFVTISMCTNLKTYTIGTRLTKSRTEMKACIISGEFYLQFVSLCLTAIEIETVAWATPTPRKRPTVCFQGKRIIISTETSFYFLIYLKQLLDLALVWLSWFRPHNIIIIKISGQKGDCI